MKFYIAFLAVVSFFCAAPFSRAEELSPPHTRISFGQKDKKKPEVIVWSYSRVFVDGDWKFSYVVAKDRVLYKLEDGASVIFVDGVCCVNGVKLDGAKGNYILSADGLQKGFIRTFK